MKHTDFIYNDNIVISDVEVHEDTSYLEEIMPALKKSFQYDSNIIRKFKYKTFSEFKDIKNKTNLFFQFKKDI